MNGAARRDALRLAAGFLLAPLAISAVAARAAGALSVALPGDPMKLARRLTRELGDGAQISLDRCWQVRFVPSGAGYRVEGRQLSAAVDAPPALAGLARIEQARRDDARFPMLLDTSGMIVGTAPATSADDVHAALIEAERMIGAARIDPGQRNDVLRMVSAIEASTIQLMGKTPPDFFVPRSGAWDETKALQLPGGLRGSVHVSFFAQAAGDSPLLHHSQRTIETTIGDSHRRSLEQWELGPISSPI
ncbi:MAG: hypothetical protein IE933_08980 [Sphingomonadales bacterium]|nr:hypothetical protein [Sphingomonadales bacterium]MBD3773654.1 hypothetical protein [Paracoccaceae bacterium]